MKGRFIGKNIRFIDCIIQYATEKNIPGLLLFIDFEKAFDFLEWSFIFDTLRFFGFGDSIINWVKVFDNNTELSCILNNGWANNFFETQRGVRQGCPLSPYLFILVAEVLAKAIRNNSNIKGIFVNNQEIKISQYADNTTLILDGSIESLSFSPKYLTSLEKSPASDSMTEKRSLFGSALVLAMTQFLYLRAGKNLKWPTAKVKALGLWISTDPAMSTSLNFNKKLEKVRKMLSCWRYRRLTLLGKITVLKSLVASQLVYLLTPLQSNYTALNEVNNWFYAFLWNGKGDKVKRKVMINDYCDGGLKMIDLFSFNKSLKSTWIKKYLDTNNNGKGKLFLDDVLKNCGGENILTSNSILETPWR